MKTFMSALLLSVSFSVAAQAETMSCIFGVSKAGTLIDENRANDDFEVVQIPLTNGSAEKTITLNGETVEIYLDKKPHADVYNMTLLLTTPASDRIPNTNWVGVIQDYLVNDGPAKDNGFNPDVKPGAVRYEFLTNRSGSLVITPKLRKSLEDNKMWGTYPLNSAVLPAENSYYVAQAVEELLKKGALKDSDVVAMGAVFSCTLNK